MSAPAPAPGSCPAAPTRVAYVVKMFPRFSETFILHEILELERLGYEVTVYSLKRPAAGPVHPALSRLRARVVYLPERPWLWLTRGMAAVLALAARSPRDLARTLGYVATRGTHQAWKRCFQGACLARALEREPVEHLHAHFASAPARAAMFASRFSGVPFSLTAHAKDIFQDGTDLDLLRDKLRAASFVVTVSEYNRAYLESLVAGPEASGRRSWPGAAALRPASIRRLYNGVDLQHFAPQERRAEGETVLAVGRLVDKKGFDDLIRAWPAVRERRPGARLVLVGEGPERGPLMTLARSLGLHDEIEWAGAEPQDRVRARLAGAAVFCLPCRVGRDGNRDGLPTVLLEALACGVPCVSTRVTGIPEIVRDGIEGRLVEEGDRAALADAIVDLMADAEQRRRMGAAARARAESLFDLRRNVAQLALWFGSPS